MNPLRVFLYVTSFIIVQIGYGISLGLQIACGEGNTGSTAGVDTCTMVNIVGIKACFLNFINISIFTEL